MKSAELARYRMKALIPWTRLSSASCSAHTCGGPFRKPLPSAVNVPSML
jgi:hypothetical protein